MQPLDVAQTPPLLWNKKGAFATDAFAAYAYTLVHEMEIDDETVIVALTMAATGIVSGDVGAFLDIVSFMEDRTWSIQNGRVDSELEACRRQFDGRGINDAGGPEYTFWGHSTSPVADALQTFAVTLMREHDIDLKTASESLIRAATRLANERGAQTWINFLGLMDERCRRLGGELDRLAAQIYREDQEENEKKPL